MAQRGYDVRIGEIAARQGFQPSVAREVYDHVHNLEQAEQVLHAMQEAAEQCGEAEIGKLTGNLSDASD